MKRKSPLKRKLKKSMMGLELKFKISKDELIFFKELIHLNHENCGYLIIDDDKILKHSPIINKSLESDIKGQSINCENVIFGGKNKYPPYRWHTHPYLTNPYPSPLDIYHVLCTPELKLSIIFTTLGIWEIYIDDSEKYKNCQKDYEKDCQNILYINNNFFKKTHLFYYIFFQDRLIDKDKDYLINCIEEYTSEIYDYCKINLKFSLWDENDYILQSPNI